MSARAAGEAISYWMPSLLAACGWSFLLSSQPCPVRVCALKTFDLTKHVFIGRPEDDIHSGKVEIRIYITCMHQILLIFRVYLPVGTPNKRKFSTHGTWPRGHYIGGRLIILIRSGLCVMTCPSASSTYVRTSDFIFAIYGLPCGCLLFYYSKN
jgi:hypothetical protein